MKDGEIQKLLTKLPDKYTLAKQILDILSNDKTKVIIEKDIKGNYYSFINDTIYISENKKDKANEAIVIAHECRHSVQNKKVQLINTIISNIVLILTFITLVLIFFNIDILVWLIVANILNIIVREYLEIDATYNSVNVLIKYVSKYISDINVEKIEKYYLKKIKLAIVLYFFKIIFDKFFPVAIIFIIKYIKYHII